MRVHVRGMKVETHYSGRKQRRNIHIQSTFRYEYGAILL